MTETVLAGGVAHMGSVVRIGDTVRRAPTPYAESVRDVLRHLGETGFTTAPLYLGTDEQGREILTYIEGRAMLAPIPRWAIEPENLGRLGDLARRLHLALRDFTPRADATWDQHTPPRWQRGVLCHNDFVMSNVIYRDRQPAGLIDFDMCSPGCAAWELGCAARHWIPLRGEGPEGRDAAVERTGRRLRALVDGYGLPSEERAEVIDVIIEAELVGLRLLRNHVAGGHPNYQDLWVKGAPQRIADRLRWVYSNRSALVDALTR